jgi:hypothetical protein
MIPVHAQGSQTELSALGVRLHLRYNSMQWMRALPDGFFESDGSGARPLCERAATTPWMGARLGDRRRRQMFTNASAFTADLFAFNIPVWLFTSVSRLD